MAMSRTRKIVLILSGIALVIFVVGVLLIALVISAFRDSAPVIADKSVVVMEVGGSLPDYVPSDPIGNRILGRDDDSLTKLVMEIRKAKVDKRVGGVLLKVTSLGVAWGKTDEIREAIADYRTSGKPVFAFLESTGNKEYYLATACDKIFVVPEGDIFITGLAANVLFFRGSLDKLGVEADVLKIGKYKNAPDQFTRKEMSEAHREVVNAILDDTFNRYVDAIARTRNKSVEDVRALIDNAPLSPEQAREANLIDGALYRDQVDEEFRKQLNYEAEEKLRIVTASEYEDVTPESLNLNTGSERIAVIYAPGTITGGESSTGATQSTGSDTILKALKTAAKDKTIKAVVLRVDSPGGTSVASDVIYHAVEVLKQTGKPVVVSMGDYAASGGYYIAANADRIVAEPSTVTGSIGVFIGKPVVKGLYDWIGVTNEYVLRGKNAGLFRESEKFSDSERAVVEARLQDSYYNAFVPKVARGRKRDPEYIDSIAQGRVWSGAQARERGLVDEFGGLERAVQIAKELAGISSEKEVRRVVLPTPRTFLEKFFSSDDDASEARAQQQAIIATLPEDARRVFKYAALFDRMKQGETMAMLPFDLEIK